MARSLRVLLFGIFACAVLCFTAWAAEVEDDAETSEAPEPDERLVDDPDESVCFPHDARVTLANGTSVPMSALAIGDNVLVGPDSVYSEVFMFTHRRRFVSHEFVVVEGTTGVKVRATKGHYLYVNGALQMASTVKTGDKIELASGQSDTVRKVSVEHGEGLYNPQTLHGDIIVDGVRASTYTVAVAPPFAHALLSPLRRIYRMLGTAITAFEEGDSWATLPRPRGQSTC